MSSQLFGFGTKQSNQGDSGYSNEFQGGQNGPGGPGASFQGSQFQRSLSPQVNVEKVLRERVGKHGLDLAEVGVFLLFLGDAAAQSAQEDQCGGGVEAPVFQQPSEYSEEPLSREREKRMRRREAGSEENHLRNRYYSAWQGYQDNVHINEVSSRLSKDVF
jgi:hypothetical protein